jgi:hypothetical protein
MMPDRDAGNYFRVSLYGKLFWAGDGGFPTLRQKVAMKQEKTTSPAVR